MLNEEVRNIMTKDHLVVGPDDSITAVTHLMHEKQIQQIPVVKDGKLEGMITSFDLWLHEHKQPNDNKQVKDIMTRKVIKIAPKDKVGTAAELFIDKRFKTLPVVNLRNELKGVITAFDVIRHVMRKEYKTPILYKEILEAD